MKLVIVESPTKAKTLSSFLGKDYIVRASYGHVRDLPKSKLGVSPENNYQVDYEVTDKGKKVVKDLKKDAEEADEILLATDPDREGEAISWHLKNLLEGATKSKRKSKKEESLPGKIFKRVVFHEITEKEIQDAFSHPHELNYNLVDSQQARRVLDRLVGYKLSPLLWKKVRYGLSAGRVQSVAVRMIVEREKERMAFVPEEYWSVDGIFEKKDTQESKVKANLIEFYENLDPKNRNDIKPTKLEVKNADQVNDIVNKIKSASSFVVESVDKSSKRRNPYPPLKTSTLQQSASNLFGFVSKKTMSIAQKLFEKGLITYHRTDSFNLSPKFLEESREYISSEIGKEYLPDHPNFYKSNKKSAQEAHEAIRPTSLNLKIKGLTDEEYKIYSLIFKRAIESQMLPMEYLQTTYKIISDNGYVFRATGSIVTFEGWGAFGKRLNLVEEEEGSSVLPSLSEGDVLKMLDLETKQHFTQPPARYSDATLVKALEDFEIGRPSTYAPTISTIQERGYVKKEGKYFYPDEVAFVVTDLLVKHFPEVIDYQFTAQMENKFDMIADGEAEWVPIIKDFYEPFESHVKEKDQELQKADFTFMGYSEEICPKCGSKMMFKLGKFGKFLSCSNYPVCEFAKPVDSEGFDDKGDPIEFETCDKCGGGMVLKMGRFGKFLACKNFPKCKNIKKYVQKVGVKCPICSEGDLIVKKFRSSTFYGCSKYPDCKFRTSKNPLETPTEVLLALYEKNETFEKEGNTQSKGIGKEGFLRSKDKKSTKPRKKSLRVKRKQA